MWLIAARAELEGARAELVNQSQLLLVLGFGTLQWIPEYKLGQCHLVPGCTA